RLCGTPGLAELASPEIPQYPTERATHLGVLRPRDPDEQAPGPDGPDDLACRIAAQDETQVAHVLLHRAAQARLGIARQLIGLVDDDDCGEMGIRG
ncbi:hypothetical protein BC936DRAFT_146298, partial [Jimgerdemannia flammicorona]